MMTLHNPAEPEPSDPPENEDEDYYFDGPYLVFTEKYHLKRGFCCQSSCRHCPYGFAKSNPEPPKIFEEEQ